MPLSRYFHIAPFAMSVVSLVTGVGEGVAVWDGVAVAIGVGEFAGAWVDVGVGVDPDGAQYCTANLGGLALLKALTRKPSLVASA